MSTRKNCADFAIRQAIILAGGVRPPRQLAQEGTGRPPKEEDIFRTQCKEERDAILIPTCVRGETHRRLRRGFFYELMHKHKPRAAGAERRSRKLKND